MVEECRNAASCLRALDKNLLIKHEDSMRMFPRLIGRGSQMAIPMAMLQNPNVALGKEFFIVSLRIIVQVPSG